MERQKVLATFRSMSYGRNVMEATQSFAPLAARLAARADEIRPVDGAEANWANFMALFVCAILQMLIALCEALDARAAADARLAAAPAPREGAARLGRAKMLVAGRAPRLALVSDVQDIAPKPDAAFSGMAEPHDGNNRLTAAPAWPEPRWHVSRLVVAPRKRGFASSASTRLFHCIIVI